MLQTTTKLTTRHLDTLALPRILLAAWAGAAIFCLSLARQQTWTPSLSQPAIPSISEDQLDDTLQQAAVSALGQREGAIIVMDPQTGRLRAIVNQALAFESAYAPGSTIKPFTALAAMRSGLIDKDSRTLCREDYRHDDLEMVCSHPKDLPPFNPAEAIAYSCNYYFGTLGERLGEEALSSTLSSFGFGQPTGVNTEGEASGKLLHGKWNARNALGEGDYLQVTPIQLITSYSALVNGGNLFQPGTSPTESFRPRVRARVEIGDEQRSVIIEGMRGAVRYGTASRAGLNLLPLNIFGKTGTSAPNHGFRTQGWFVGFASDIGEGAATVAPDSGALAVLVFLKRGHGAKAAEVARPIFAEYAKNASHRGTETKRNDRETREESDTGTRRRGDANKDDPRSHTNQFRVVSCDFGDTVSPRLRVAPSPRLRVSSSQRLPVAAPAVRVHLVGQNVTRTVTLEDYVLGVAATEGSTEDEPEALKALAVSARTYTLKNLGRHAHEGYDFCTTTHCQRYTFSDPAQTRTAVVAAVSETKDVVLRDDRGQLADSYYGASCGGMTADVRTLWGAGATPYLRGVRDEYCTTMPHHSWTDTIPATELLKALRTDPRTDVGARLNEVVVSRRDATGRAELISIEGEQRRTVKGWDFKIIVGRSLGWNVLKSSRFEISRAGSDFVFRGSGFGHGLGLCQEGAHVMARRGVDYRRILEKYFPGTKIGQTSQLNVRQIADPSWSADLLSYAGATEIGIDNPAAVGLQSGKTDLRRVTLSSGHFRVNYSIHREAREVKEVINILESTRTDLLRRLAAVSASADQFPALEIFINDTTGDFVGRTGQPWWAAAATRGNWIELQPLELLQRRGVLETTLRHELVHALIDTLGHGRTPRWLGEGLALYLAGEGPLISRYTPKSKMTVAEIEEALSRARSVEGMRTAYAAAYREVSNLIKTEGEASVWRRVGS